MDNLDVFGMTEGQNEDDENRGHTVMQCTSCGYVDRLKGDHSGEELDCPVCHAKGTFRPVC